MIRIALRAVGLVLSLVSMGAMLTSRGAEGEPSVLERIPALMTALDAKARELESIRAAGSVEGGALAARRAGPALLAGGPEVPLGDAVAGTTRARQVVMPPEPGGEVSPSADAVPVHAGLPSGASGVRVHRGLP